MVTLVHKYVTYVIYIHQKFFKILNMELIVLLCSLEDRLLKSLQCLPNKVLLKLCIETEFFLSRRKEPSEPSDIWTVFMMSLTFKYNYQRCLYYFISTNFTTHVHIHSEICSNGVD